MFFVGGFKTLQGIINTRPSNHSITSGAILTSSWRKLSLPSHAVSATYFVAMANIDFPPGWSSERLDTISAEDFVQVPEDVSTYTAPPTIVGQPTL